MDRTRAIASLLGLLAVACSDHGLHGKVDDVWACPEEPSVGLVLSEPSCRMADPAPVVTDPWRLTPLWTYTDFPDGDSEAPALVGYLADTDGDGVHGVGDTPVVVLGGTSTVVALDGATGTVRWQWDRGGEPTLGAGLAIADLDADGRPEVVTLVFESEVDDWDLSVVVLEGDDGVERWRAPAGSWHDNHEAPVTVADLDGDGTAEILVGTYVLSGLDGQVATVIPASGLDYSSAISVADLDENGSQEILTEGAAFDVDGVELWNARSGLTLTSKYQTPLVLQADSDPQPEVVWVSEGFSIWNHDGTPSSVVLDLSVQHILMAWPPCAADLDGDKTTEFVVPVEGWFLEAYHLDGVMAWSKEIESDFWDPYEWFGGCAAFDLDGDGAAEVLFSNHNRFMVVDGRTGTTLAEYPAGASQRETSHPTVADIDGDGHAEILLPGEDPYPSLTVLRHDGAGWAAAGAGWGITDYAVTNSNANGYVPPRPAPWWLLDNTWRATPSGADVLLADLAVEVEGACGSDNSVVVRVVNTGTGTAPAGVLLEVEEGGVEVGRVVLPEVQPATALDELVIAVPEGTGDTLRVIVDADSAIAECNEANNVWEGEWREPPSQ